ncbi:P-loop containing nucleoside triphosphate hydrolase protein [Pyronema domesticum]|nr:P-loop containing nucleoside triphosphate hydrolase protein [Pyronema domesticum]
MVDTGLPGTKRTAKLAYVPAKEKECTKEEEVKVPRIRGSKLEYKRMDELYNKERHDYYLTDTTTDKKSSDDVWEEYSFIVRRTFNWKNEYQKTMIDIKSEELVSVLRKVMRDVRMINLSVDKPVLEPNLLFNYLPDFQEVLQKEKEQPEDVQNKKKIDHLDVLINYLLEDYAPITKVLYPLLEEDRITFDHLWAVFRPGTIIHTLCPGTNEPMCLKLDWGSSKNDFKKGTWFQLDCSYIDYDGKAFGEAKATVKIPEFVGVKRIDALPAFPLARHPEVEAMREKLISRGRKFGTYSGAHYKYYEGMAYFRTQEGITKVNVRSRIMVDSLTFRKMNPGCGVRVSNPEDSDSDEDFGTPSNSTSPWKSAPAEANHMDSIIGSAPSLSYKVTSFGIQLVRSDAKKERKTGVSLDPKDMTVEQLLICSPTIPGFSLGDKIYLQFAVENIRDIVFNKTAFDSLVLPEKKKSIVKALVETHTKNKQGKKPGIDDIIKGKGQGLVVVLHGRPGVGKTLTAEGISESLQLPLYMIGTSQLSTSPEKLDAQLTKILEVAHGWGAVLLLDEADVFLERRSVHDIHRNALVCVFLRQLEYFQGILFMTTNRVETFDEAFQSRIHIALRYSDLDSKARHAVWTQFLDMVSHEEPRKILTQEQLNVLSRKNLNGRQIKNIVRTAQALAYSMGEDLSLKHIMEVLEVTEEFEHDLKGTGQIDGMLH